jgi:RimJ/RimL family protein N-acetyltransferase
MTLGLRRRPPDPALQGVDSSVRIRAIEASDAPLVLDAFARLSDRSRRLRFLMGKPRLTDAELRFFTDVDHHDHEALVAVSRSDGRIVGGARFVRSAHEPDSAELAITVVDDWQGNGLGSRLMTSLTQRAREEGVARFVALVADDNDAVVHLLGKFGPDLRLVERDGHDVEYEIVLDRPVLGASLAWLAAC